MAMVAADVYEAAIEFAGTMSFRIWGDTRYVPIPATVVTPSGPTGAPPLWVRSAGSACTRVFAEVKSTFGLAHTPPMTESVFAAATTGAFIWAPVAETTCAGVAASAKFGRSSVTCHPAPEPESSITVNGAITALVSCGVPFMVTLLKFPTVGQPEAPRAP